MKIRTQKINYELDESMLGRLNIIQGDSSTGKSTLYEILSEYDKGTQGIYYSGLLPVYICEEGSDSKAAMLEENLTKLEGKHYILIDETNVLIKDGFKPIRRLLKGTEHTFIIITRRYKNLDSLPIEIDCHFKIRYYPDESLNRIERYYEDKYNLLTPTEVDIIAVEDELSGYQFFTDYYPNIEVMSYKTRTRVESKVRYILRELEQRHLHKIVLIVVDSFAYGFLFNKVVKLKQKYSNLYAVTWKSFEEYILRSDNFLKFPSELSCDTERNYAEYLGEIVPDYNKSYLPYCMRKEGECGNPTKVIPKIKAIKNGVEVEVNEPVRDCKNCPIFVTDRVKNYIHSDLQYIREPQSRLEVEGQPISQQPSTVTSTSQSLNDDIQSF